MQRIVLLPTALIIIAMALLPARGNAQTPASLSISGVVWQDDNGDGVHQPLEAGIAGVILQLDGGTAIPIPPAGSTQVFPTPASPPFQSSQRFVTGNDGQYRFNGLAEGTYHIDPTGTAFGNWLETAPTRALSLAALQTLMVSLTNRAVENVDLGLFPASGLPTFGGQAWQNAKPLPSPKVRALVSGVDCTLGTIGPPGDISQYWLVIASETSIPGCGREGSSIAFYVNGMRSNETAVWHSTGLPQAIPSILGSGSPTLNSTYQNLTLGPGFAAYTGRVQRLVDGIVQPLGPGEQTEVEAFVGNAFCGSANFGAPNAIIIVPPESLQPGCGKPGSVVRFVVSGSEPADVIDQDGDLSTANDVTTWQPGFLEKRLIVREPAHSTLPILPPFATPVGGPRVFTPDQIPNIQPPNTGDAGLHAHR